MDGVHGKHTITLNQNSNVTMVIDEVIVAHGRIYRLFPRGEWVATNLRTCFM